MYNRQLLVQLRKFKKVAKRMRVPLEMQCHLSFFSAIGETAYQFILCELSKICNYIETGAAYYTRNYWKDAEASAAGGLEDGEEAVNVRAVILYVFAQAVLQDFVMLLGSVAFVQEPRAPSSMPELQLA